MMPADVSSGIRRCRAATTRIERVDAALALAGLTWRQFQAMTGRKRAQLYGTWWPYTLRLLANYTGADAEWIAHGRLPAADVPAKSQGMTQDDYEDLCFMLGILGYRRDDATKSVEA